MNLILIIPLLLWDINTGCAHSIVRKDDAPNELNTTDSQDLYEVKDGISTIQFVYPKQAQPTLREIVYYHVIETPYNEETVSHDETPAHLDDSDRLFTNSHAGYQFLGSQLDQGPNEELPSKPDIFDEYLKDEELIKVHDNKISPTDEPEYEIVYMDDEVENDGTETTSEMAALVVTEVTNNQKNEDHQTTERPENIQIPTEAAKRARKLLFDRVKEKYSTKHNERENTSQVLRRRKREVTEKIPEAPKLEELDLDSLPPHIRNMIAVGQNYFKTHDKKDKELEGVRHKIRDVFDKLDGNKEAGDDPKPRTHGMRLDGENGYVWNDMTNPGVYYEIEPPNDKHEVANKEKKRIKASEQLDGRHKDDVNLQKHKNIEEIEAISDEPHSKINHENDNDNKEETNLEKLRKQKKPQEKEDLIMELMESEQFWKWLEDWTAMYMEELTKYIKKQIKAEVKKQVKKQTQPQKDDKEKKEMPEHEPAEENKKDKTETLEETTEISKDNNENSKTEEDEDKHEKNDTLPVSINAKNMYGSSIGNDKVTNFFIFYPGNEIKDVLTDVKPVINSASGTFLIGTSDKDEKEENETETKETSTPLIDKRIKEDEESTEIASEEIKPENATLDKPPKGNDDKTTTETVKNENESKTEETDLKEESSDDNKDDEDSSENDNEEEVKEENDENSKKIEGKDDAETEKANKDE